MCVVDCARVVRRLADVAGKGWAGTGALMCVCVWPAACGRVARHVVAALVLFALVCAGCFWRELGECACCRR